MGTRAPILQIVVPDTTLHKHVKVLKQIKRSHRPRAPLPILPHVRVPQNKNVIDAMKQKMIPDFIIKQYVRETMACNYSEIRDVASKWVYFI